MTDRQARLGLIGLGWWGGEVVQAAHRSGTARIVTCFGRDPERRRAFASRFECGEVASVDEMLADPDIDGVVVVTPHSTHAPLAVRAAESGKSVLVEKPLALTTADAARAVEAARDNGVALQVGHNRRRQAANRSIKAAIERGELGRILHIESHFTMPTAHGWVEGSWKRDPAEVPLGATTLMGIHMIDTILYLMGGLPESVFAISRVVHGRTRVDDTTMILLDFAPGPVACIATSAELARNVSLAVHGTEGSAFNLDDGAGFSVQDRSTAQPEPRPLAESDPLAEQLEEFGRAALGETQPEVDGERGADVVAVLAAALESTQNRRSVSL